MLDFSTFPDTIAIVGSRSFARGGFSDRIMREKVYRFVDQLKDGTEVVSGGAIGIDSYAEERARYWATKDGRLSFTGFYPDKSLPSPRRYFKRNAELVKYLSGSRGLIVAFADVADWDGTRNTIESSRQYALESIILFYTLQGAFKRASFTTDGLFEREDDGKQVEVAQTREGQT